MIEVLISYEHEGKTYESLARVPPDATDEYLERLTRSITRKIKEALNRKV